ncbi:TetR/AcrR family transcriptional regulator [Longispora urticae]
MPLPRFHRLTAERRADILRVARAEFAQHGPEAASYNQIIALAEISKASAYHYFDGKEDLLNEVLTEVRARLLGALGPWVPVETDREFWAALKAGSARLVEHLGAHPDDRALADHALARAPREESAAWLAAVLDNGIALGVIRGDVDRELLLGVTAGALGAVDGWALAGGTDLDQGWSLLAGLWTAPGGRRA